MLLEEPYYLLKSSRKLLDDIKAEYRIFLIKKEVPIELKDKIKELLGKLNSCLEYQAFIIFTIYCERHVPTERLEYLKSKVYFPCKDSSNAFHFYIKKHFPGLVDESKEIFDMLYEVQSFNDKNQWLKYLNKLNNNNKHRMLSKQRRKKTTLVRYGQVGGLTLKNVTFENVDVPIRYGNQDIDFESLSPFNSNFDYHTEIEFFFTDINKPVIMTLENLYNGVLSFTEKFNDYLSQNSLVPLE